MLKLGYYSCPKLPPRNQYSCINLYGLVVVGIVQPLSVSVEDDTPNNRFNDAKCDRRGRLWCGTADGGSATVPGFPSTKGNLYCYDGGKCIVVFRIT